MQIMLNLMQIAMQAVGVKRKVFFLAFVLFCCGGEPPSWAASVLTTKTSSPQPAT